jgi:hypothetical protein
MMHVNAASSVIACRYQADLHDTTFAQNCRMHPAYNLSCTV